LSLSQPPPPPPPPLSSASSTYSSVPSLSPPSPPPAPLLSPPPTIHPLPQVGGFVGSGFPEALVEALRARHDATGSPRRLGAVVVAAVGDGAGRGLGRLAVPSLLARLTYAWIGLCPEFGPHLRSGAIEGVNLPLGAVSHMLRDCAAGRPGPLSRVGVGTFVDPRAQGGAGAGGGGGGGGAADYPVRVVEVGGVDYLHYRAPEAVDVALLRGSVADADGNVGFGREALLGDALNQAIAAHNSWHRKEMRQRQQRGGSLGEGGLPPPLRVRLRFQKRSSFFFPRSFLSTNPTLSSAPPFVCLLSSFFLLLSSFFSLS